MSYAILAAAIVALILSTVGAATDKLIVRLLWQLIGAGIVAVILYGFLHG